MADSASPPPSSEHSTNAASTSKHQKRSSSSRDDDRISRLPDAVICHILSFIQMKYTVGTSVHSKRWKFIWTSVPNLDFEDYLLFKHVNSVNYAFSFMSFVDRVLSLHTSSFTRTYRLCCYNDYPLSRVEEWIGATITGDIVNLDLQFSASHLLWNIDQNLSVKSLPGAFFNRKNLVSLRLVNIALKVPTSVNYPSVRDIFFSSVQLLDDDSLKNLLSGSPVLKKLFIDRTAWDNADTLYVCSSTLIELSIHTSHNDDKDSGYKVVIEAPSLKYLYLDDDVGDMGLRYLFLDDDDYNMVNLSSLELLSLLLTPSILSPDLNAFNDRLFKIFRKASHLKDLTLGCYIVQSLGAAHFENLPMFNHLTHLSITFDIWGLKLPILMCLLEYSPNLVNFELEMVYGHDDGDCLNGGDHLLDGNLHPPHFVPKCLSSSIENIIIKEMDFDDADAGEMINYFLKNAMVLKELSISFKDVYVHNNTKLLRKIETLPRSSSTCQIVFCEKDFHVASRHLFLHQLWDSSLKFN